jgi:hypothetical protein
MFRIWFRSRNGRTRSVSLILHTQHIPRQVKPLNDGRDTMKSISKLAVRLQLSGTHDVIRLILRAKQKPESVTRGSVHCPDAPSWSGVCDRRRLQAV